MPKVALSPTISPEQLRDEADRVAQGFTADEQARTVDLMTPVMSEAEQKASLSPPSKALSDPLPPLFEDMAYLTAFPGREHRTPQNPARESSHAEHSNPATPMRCSGSGSLNQRVPHSSHHKSTTSPTRRRLNFTAASSTDLPRSSSQHSPHLNFDDFIQHSPSAKSRLLKIARNHSAAASPPHANISASKERRRSSLRGKSTASESPTTVRVRPPRSHMRASEAVGSMEGDDDQGESGTEMQDEADIIALKEAQREYGNRKEPDFVIGKPRDGLTRKVDGVTRNGTFLKSELCFEYWDQDQTRGFWTYTDDDGDRFIVKFFGAGLEYRPWLGIEKGYHRNAMAFPWKNGRSRVPSTFTVQGTTAVKSEMSEMQTSEDEQGRALRKRNIDQIHPYTTDMMNYKRSKDGKKKKNFKVSSANARPDQHNQPSSTGPLSERVSGQYKAASKSRLSFGSIEQKTGLSQTPETMSIETIQTNTTLYVFVNSEFDAPPGTIYLKSCKDVNSFFSMMPLVAGVEEGDIRQITVRFDWIPESDLNTIRMVRGLSDSYDKMVEEISKAPAWRKGGDGRVGVLVNVVLKS